MSTYRDSLPPEQRPAYDQAITAAGRLYWLALLDLPGDEAARAA